MKAEQCNNREAGSFNPTSYTPDDGQLGWKMQCCIIKRRRCVNINISTKLHKDFKEWNTKLEYTVQQDAAV
jgi:hypothetical protein